MIRFSRDIHANTKTTDDSNKASTLSAITSDTPSPDEEDDLCHVPSLPSDDQQPGNDTHHHHYQSEEEEAEEDANDGDEQDSNTAPICECGRQLDSGWKCSHCRRQCPICNRSLSIDAEEYCERCFRLCTYHGLFSIAFGSIECQQCKND
ncbi:uncharacterized protein ATC70_011729 [Mucor velutinosus]|uniref:Uncharacterized protein n=1 Tax=Mucor velutinosus TaxID=708070 RepID=A0AAN7DFX6_9FUNG|nr:hypothetical protein ATC70_011729 [Mucor velutinosus]